MEPLLYFVSLDGRSFLVNSFSENNYSWKEASQDMEMRTIIKEALKVAEGKQLLRLSQFQFI